MDYYSFIIDGEKVGYYEKEDHAGNFYQNAFLVMNGDTFENPFTVRHEAQAITAFRIGDGAWQELSGFPIGSFPTSAFELLALRLADGETFVYDRIHEGTGKLTPKVTIRRAGKRIIETVDGKDGRYLVLDEQGAVSEYGWGGGAKSLRMRDRAEAVAGTPFADRKP